MYKMTRIVLLSVLFALALGQGVGEACDVLLLGDSFGESNVQSALEAGGHTVVFAGLYYQWDGVTPNVNDFDVVVFLDGQEYGNGFIFNPAAESAIVDFVHDGGGLVMTEWVLYDVWYQGGVFGPEFDDMMPAYYLDYEDEDPSTWVVQDTGHFIAAGLPASWTDDGYYSYLIPHSAATVVIETPQRNPMLSYRTDLGGTVVHFNNVATEWSGEMSEFTMQALVNSVAFICQITPVQESDWGTIKSMY